MLLHQIFLIEIFDKAVGYELKGLTYNPFVWIDDKSPEWQPDIKALQDKCQEGLEIMKANMETIFHGALTDLDYDNDPTIAKIVKNIDDMKLLRFIGRYAYIEGPYPMLVAPDGTVYFHKTAYLMWMIHEADFTDPEIYVGGYFAG